MLLNSSNDSLGPNHYHLGKNGLDCFKKLSECNRTHSSWPDLQFVYMEENVEDEEDIEEDVEEDVNIHELEYTNGSNEIVRIFNQKCVICLE